MKPFKQLLQHGGLFSITPSMGFEPIRPFSSQLGRNLARVSGTLRLTPSGSQRLNVLACEAVSLEQGCPSRVLRSMTSRPAPRTNARVEALQLFRAVDPATAWAAHLSAQTTQAPAFNRKAPREIALAASALPMCSTTAYGQVASSAENHRPAASKASCPKPSDRAAAAE